MDIFTRKDACYARYRHAYGMSDVSYTLRKKINLLMEISIMCSSRNSFRICVCAEHIILRKRCYAIFILVKSCKVRLEKNMWNKYLHECIDEAADDDVTNE